MSYNNIFQEKEHIHRRQQEKTSKTKNDPYCSESKYFLSIHGWFCTKPILYKIALGQKSTGSINEISGVSILIVHYCWIFFICQTRLHSSQLKHSVLNTNDHIGQSFISHFSKWLDSIRLPGNNIYSHNAPIELIKAPALG